MRNIGITLSVGLLIAAGAACAQTAGNMTFDVASVKPAAPLDMQKLQQAMLNGETPKVGMHVDAGKVEFTYVDLKNLIAIAYKLKPYQVTGPDWLASQRFDIIAKFPGGATREDIPQMLKALLIERFKLDTRLDKKENPVLALVVGKGGPKLKESADLPVAIDENAPLKPGEMKMDGPDGPIRMTVDPKTGGGTMNMGVKGVVTYKLNGANTAAPGAPPDMSAMSLHMDAKQMTMSGFAEMLTQFSQMGGTGGRTVVDMTDLKGHYETSLDVPLADLINMARAAGMDMPNLPAGGGAPGAVAASDPSGGTTLFGAVQSLGLKLEQRKAVTEQLVVEHAEKTPVEN